MAKETIIDTSALKRLDRAKAHDIFWNTIWKPIEKELVGNGFKVREPHKDATSWGQQVNRFISRGETEIELTIDIRDGSGSWRSFWATGDVYYSFNRHDCSYKKTPPKKLKTIESFLVSVADSMEAHERANQHAKQRKSEVKSLETTLKAHGYKQAGWNEVGYNLPGNGNPSAKLQTHVDGPEFNVRLNDAGELEITSITFRNVACLSIPLAKAEALSCKHCVQINELKA